VIEYQDIDGPVFAFTRGVNQDDVADQDVSMVYYLCM
jgi:hypothetical protein